MSTSPVELAKYYSVDDLTSATTGGGRLNNLLLSVSKGLPLSILSQQYLESKGLNALLGFLTGVLSKEEFYRRALLEREQRIAMAIKRQLELEAIKIAEQKAAALRYETLQAQYKAERIKRESDPKFIARRKNQDLRRKFGVDVFVEEDHFKQLMQILRTLDAKSRLSELDSIWLKVEGRDYQTDEIWHAYHRIEADFYIAEYKRTSDPWQAVNASAHLRKCAAAASAVELLSAIPAKHQEHAKLKSAIRTTHGGALRDLGKRTDALKMGAEAHALQPNNFRPCTLLGALNIELGNIEEGHNWYLMAEARGANRDSIEYELRSLLLRMSEEKRKAAIAELLKIAPREYDWLRRVFKM
ncbi:hypothetical protein [Aeromonas sobria]|uniref:hypothetical protein n=1 Tax=Aeromonas sobria TaxID=646 RepID=UPI00111A75EA|nr:hypothetical protein [Aeromonas sobria]TNH95371.1 hypothetical protein CF137_10675 [Aeromonas sobria]